MQRVGDRITVGEPGVLDRPTGGPVVLTGAREGEAPVAEPHSAWPASNDLAAVRLRVVGAIGLIETGRYEPGVRTLRHAVGGLARRADWAHAGEGAIALASALLRRGQPEGAHHVLDRAADYCTRAGRHDLLIDIATLCGEGWIDRTRLDEAEAVISGALTSARGAHDDLRSGIASLALSRCRFWRGRYKEADVAIAGVDEQTLPIELQVRLARFRAKAAVGRRDFASAMRWASLAIEQARMATDHRLIAAAACTKAFVHLSLGDVHSAAHNSRASIAAARSARDPLRVTRARLMLAEIDRRADRLQACATVVNRLRQMARDRLPPLVRLQCDLLYGLLTSSHPLAGASGRRTASTGPEGLALYLPETSAARPGPTGLDHWIDAIVEIVSVCQTAEDETTVLSEICSKVRRQLRAAGLAYVVTDHGAPAVVASSGSRIDLGIASRALDAGVPIAPQSHDDRVEAAAPVMNSGSVLGALVAHWTPGSLDELSRASAVLAVAATAATAAISAVLARRARTRPVAGNELLGAAPAMAELRRAVERAAAAPFAVLVEGETGTGKELVARAVHRLGPRRDRPFCTVNCAALPDDLVEGELFGHARGAFTGAVSDRPGVFEEANGGTLFLDEIGELSPRAQAKLLRVVQGGELRRVGENLSRRIDVRIVAATNRDLRQEAALGHFRSDLLYRLDVIRLSVPPLRDRGEDIATLFDHFWREAAARVASRATLAPTTVAALARYDWPGNVRELQNVAAALAVQCPKRGVVPPTALPAHLVGRSGPEPCPLEDARRTFEERFVRAALVRSGGHRARAAEELGVTRQGLTKLMTRLGINEQESDAAQLANG